MNRYPELVIDLKKLEHNIKEIKKRCDEKNIKIAGVIKGCNGLPEVAMTFNKAKVDFIASSRLEHLIPLKDKIETPLMMIRIPMISEVEDVIRYTDISLNSEIETLKALNEEAKKQNKTHKVILMKDLGDLREGFFEDNEIIQASLLVEKELSNLELVGIGTNLGCYGSVLATREKLDELVQTAEKIEKAINRKLEYISGGSTTSLPRVFYDDIPERINMLRIGEGILLATEDLLECDNIPLYNDVFKLKCEVIEVKDKPTYPIGELSVDSFGNKNHYEDRGIRKKALLAIGKVDYGYIDKLIIKEKGASIVGASSDHTIIDIEDCERNIKVGDIIEFDLCYATLVMTSSSENIHKVYLQ